MVGLLGGWLLLGLWGLRGLGCALTWGYESVRSHGQDGVGGPCGADCALLPEGARSIEHIGSAHDDAELAVLKEVARQRLNAGQLSFDLPGLNSENDAGSAPQEPAGTGCVAPIASNRMGVLLEALEAAWKTVGLDRLDGADEVFRQLVTARLIEPTSKQNSLRVLTEAGLSPVSYATVKRHLPSYAAEDFTRNLSRLLAGYARIGRASLVLFDAYDPVLRDRQGRRLSRAGLVQGKTPGATDHGRAAHRRDRVPSTGRGLRGQQGRDRHHDPDDQRLHGRLRPPRRRGRPRRAAPESQPWPAGPSDQRRDETVYYRYSADRARRTLRGIDTQVAKAEKAVAGKIPVKRNRFVHLSGATRSINRDLEKRARTLAGWKGYVTNLPNPDPETVISAYHRLYNIEKSFRMSKSDLRARPIYHHLRQSIEAHLTIVTAALAMARWLETTTGWSIRRLITTARRYRTITINIAGHTLTAAAPLPPDLTQALHNIHHDTK